MNFNLTQIPERTVQPRKHGLTMVMDKGLSYGEAENFLSVALPHTDIIKLGFGTSFVTPNLRKKIELYQSHGLPVYFGGTLFEAFVIRNNQRRLKTDPASDTQDQHPSRPNQDFRVPASFDNPHLAQCMAIAATGF